MKKKLMSLLLVLAMLLALPACGGGDPAVQQKSSAPEEDIEAPSDTPEFEAPVPEPEPEPEPEPVEMHYTFEDGTLTCSGNGEVVREDWIEAVKNALFETSENLCRAAVKTLVLEPGIEAIGYRAFLGVRI